VLSPELAARMTALAEGQGEAGGAWRGVDDFLPLLERMRAEGAVVVLKLDGKRTGPDDSPPYTVVISGGGLADDFVTVEGASVQDALARATLEYAERAWPAR
jgi:hypothetical protein